LVVLGLAADGLSQADDVSRSGDPSIGKKLLGFAG